MKMLDRLIHLIRGNFVLKIFLSFAVSVFIVLSIYTSIVLVRETQNVDKALIREGQTLAGLLAYSSKAAVFAEHKAELDEIVKGAMSRQNVMGVSIFAAEDYTLLGKWRKKDAHAADSEDIDKAAFARMKNGSESEISVTEDSLDCYTPVIIEALRADADSLYFDGSSAGKKRNVIGYVKVTMDKSLLKKELKSILIRSVVTFVLVFLAAGLFLILGLKRLTRPLTLLTEQARRLGQGEAVEKLPVDSPDEVGRLTAGFNKMDDDLRKRQEEKDKLEEELRNAQKMEAVGTLARGIAHDFNNILTTVQGSVYILRKKLENDAALMHYIEKMINSIDKARNLTQELITFSRIQKIDLRPIDLKHVVHSMSPVLEGITCDRVSLEISLPEGAVPIIGDPVQIEQILLNLCSNACDAMPDGGALALSLGIVKAADGGPGPGPGDLVSLGGGEYGVLTLADTGIGMDDETRQRIFEPFFTTKDVGKGTGLGLAIVYGIVQQHKGHLLMNTKEGEGTTFRIFFPLIGRDAAENGLHDPDSTRRAQPDG